MLSKTTARADSGLIDSPRGFEPKLRALYLRTTRTPDVRQAEEMRFVNADLIRAHVVHRRVKREIKQRSRALRGAANAINHPARARQGSCAGRMGQHPQGVC